MSMQAKLVDPNGKPKAIIAAHDRIASGKEFALFQSLLGVMALGAVPSNDFSPNGQQMARLIEPHELVSRAETIVQQAMGIARLNDWAVEVETIDFFMTTRIWNGLLRDTGNWGGRSRCLLTTTAGFRFSMLRSINSTFKRKPRKRVVSRSFRIPPEVDKALDEEAAKRDVSKSFLIKDIIHGWFVYQQAKARIE